MEDIQSGVLGLAVLSAMLAFSSSSRCKSSTVCKVSLKFIKNKWISNKLHNLVYNWYIFLNLHIWIFLPIEILVHVHNLNENVIFTIHVKLVSFLHIQKKWFVNIITCKYTKKEKESNKSGSLEMCITWYNIFSSCEKYYTVVSCTDGHHAVIKCEFKIEKKKDWQSVSDFHFGYNFWLKVTCSELDGNTYHFMQLQYQLILHCNK